MRVLLVASGFNSLTQRVWCWLREGGHTVEVQDAVDPTACVRAGERFRPDLVLCPHLDQRLPAAVWRRWRTIVLRPAPAGDRGPAPLERAIANGETSWGVTAIQVSEEVDAGPIWASRTFALPAEPPRRASLYRGPVADAALACAAEVLERVTDPGFVPDRRSGRQPWAPRPRRALWTDDQLIDWSGDTLSILRRIRAADPSPGVPAVLAGVPVRCFDAHPLARPELPGWPGQVIGRSDGSLLVRTGDGGIWLGQLCATGPHRCRLRLPATVVLAEAAAQVGNEMPRYVRPRVAYRRMGRVGRVYFDFYQGEMSTMECRVLRDALRHAARQDTSVILLQSGPDAFSNGIHLSMIEAADNPTVEAWRNINAIEDVCEAIVSCPQPVVAALTGGAGAGGVMMALGADRVIARAGTVLNPYFSSLGVTPSELRTATYAARAGDEAAERLLTACLPVSVTQARSAGLVDAVGPRDPEGFTDWAIGFANGLLLAGSMPSGQASLDQPGGRSWRRNRRLRRLSSSAFQRIQLGEEPGRERDQAAGRERRNRPPDSSPRLTRHRLARATHPFS